MMRLTKQRRTFAATAPAIGEQWSSMNVGWIAPFSRVQTLLQRSGI